MNFLDLILWIALALITGSLGVLLVESALKEGKDRTVAVPVKSKRRLPWRKPRNREW